MKEIMLDENGNVIDYLAVRNDEIKEKLQPALDMFLEENKKTNKMGFKKFGYRLSLQIDNALRAYGLMTADEVASLDYDKIEDNWNKFRDLIAYYNLYFEIVANKQLFCAFLRINNRIYSQLEKHQDDDIRSLMISINDSFVGLGFTASESGNADSKATKIRLGAKDVGHSVVSASEELAVQAATGKTPLELEREMAQILGLDGKNVKAIRGKK